MLMRFAAVFAVAAVLLSPAEAIRRTGGKLSEEKLCPSENDSPCSGHGVCADHDEDGTHTCFCEPGYLGEGCSREACRYHCSEHGRCNMETRMCDCESGWAGLSCSDSECPNACSGHGICAQNGTDATLRACFCVPGFKGDACDQLVCPHDEHLVECSSRGRCNKGKCDCLHGFWGDNCGLMKCNIPCVHGECECDADAGSCTCNCEPGFHGPMCDRRCPRNCSGHGKCDHWARCQCDDGWKGVDCAQPSCLNDCSNHGVCNHNFTCTCELGWHGDDCSKLRCPESCNWRSKQGECLFDKCVCYPGFAGEACEQVLAPAEEEGHPCGENCYEFCRSNSECSSATEQAFAFRTGADGSTFEVAVQPFAGPMVDAQVEAQSGQVNTNKEGRKCYVHCLQNCFSDCFEKVHTLDSDERQAAMDDINSHLHTGEGELAVSMANVTGDITEVEREHTVEGGVSMSDIVRSLEDRAGEVEGRQ